MSLYRTIAAVGALGLAATLSDCSKVELCDRFPDDVRCSSTSDMGPLAQLQVSPHRIPLQLTPAMLNIKLLNAPATPQQITLVQNGKMQNIGMIGAQTTTISPNLRSLVLPGPATIQVGSQQVAVRLYVPPVFTAVAVQRQVASDLGTAPMQPVSPTALGVTSSGKIIMLGQYGPPPIQGIKSYVLNSPMIDPAMTPNLSSYTGSRYTGTLVSGFALTNTHMYFPSLFADPMTPTDIKQIDSVSGSQLQERYFPFSSMSLFTADSSGQLIAALTTDVTTSVKKVSLFTDSDLSLNSSAAFDMVPDPANIAFLGAGDFNGDSIADLATWEVNGNARVYLGTDIQKVNLKYNSMYSSSLTMVSKIAGATLTGVAVGDLDGDLLSDIALISSTGTISVVLNGLDGNFDAPISVTMPTGFGNPSALAIGNVNMDPLLQSSDLIIANNGTTKLIGALINQATANWPN